jgi:hypothetical protein
MLEKDWSMDYIIDSLRERPHGVPVGHFAVALDPRGRTIVKRDMELIRKILIQVESWPNVEQRCVELPEYDRHIVVRHVEMLCAAGFIEPFDSRRPATGFIVVKDLSWDGHEFLDSVRNDSVWGKVKEELSAAQLLSAPLELVKYTAIEVGKTFIKQHLGIA